MFSPGQKVFVVKLSELHRRVLVLPCEFVNLDPIDGRPLVRYESGFCESVPAPQPVFEYMHVALTFAVGIAARYLNKNRKARKIDVIDADGFTHEVWETGLITTTRPEPVPLSHG